MTPSSAPEVGRVLSADIAVPEHERIVAFYTRVLGTGARPLWRDDLMNSLGVPVIGVGERVEAYDHLPLQWMPHIQVSDVGASVVQALEHGGRELMHHQDEDGRSRWAVLCDPDGAAFGLIPPVPSEEVPEPGDSSPHAGESTGRISWLDLTVPAVAATRDFYQAVVGWSASEIQKEDGRGRYSSYILAAEDGTAVAGVRHARGGNRGLPQAWIIYLPVGDLGESLRRVTEEGGEVIRPPGSEPEREGAVIRDPVGAYLGLMPG